MISESEQGRGGPGLLPCLCNAFGEVASLGACTEHVGKPLTQVVAALVIHALQEGVELCWLDPAQQLRCQGRISVGPVKQQPHHCMVACPWQTVPFGEGELGSCQPGGERTQLVPQNPQVVWRRCGRAAGEHLQLSCLPAQGVGREHGQAACGTSFPPVWRAGRPAASTVGA